MEVYCYAQQCSSRNGGIVPQSEIDQWFDEHPDAPEGEDYCVDWDLVAWGTEEEIIDQCRKIILDTKGADSNARFKRDQCRNVLKMIGASERRSEQITIEIVTHNESFDESPTGEIAWILRELADRFEAHGLPEGELEDSDGLICGGVKIDDID